MNWKDTNRPRYNEDNTCPKCGNSATTHYIPSTGMDIGPTGLRRKCITCGYSWFEQALDEKDDPNL